MTILHSANFDVGTSLATYFTNVNNGNGNLTITVPAALNGTAQGLNMRTVVSSGADNVNEPISPPASNDIYLSFYVNFSNTGLTGSLVRPVEVAVQTTGNDYFTVNVDIFSNLVHVNLDYEDDIGGTQNSGQFVISSVADVFIEVYAPVGGPILLDVNTVNQFTSGAVTNSTVYSNIDTFIVTKRNLASTPVISGSVYLDETILTDGLAAATFDIITHGRGASALLFNQQAAPTLDNTFAFVVVEDTAGGQIRYLKMDLPVKDVTATPMVEVHTDATDTDGMVTTAASAVKMFFAGDDGVGGFVESHAVLTGVTTDLYSNAARAINAMTASPGLSSEAIILESAVSNEELRHTIDDFVATQATNNLSGFLNFIDSSIGVIFFKTPEKPNLEDCQAFVVGTDPSGGVNQVAWFVQLMTGANIVIVDEAIAALQNAAMITGIGIGA